MQTGWRINAGWVSPRVHIYYFWHVIRGRETKRRMFVLWYLHSYSEGQGFWFCLVYLGRQTDKIFNYSQLVGFQPGTSPPSWFLQASCILPQTSHHAGGIITQIALQSCVLWDGTSFTLYFCSSLYRLGRWHGFIRFAVVPLRESQVHGCLYWVLYCVVFE